MRMVIFMFMRQLRITRGGQVSIPAEIRHRWGTARLNLDDLGDRLVLTPAPDDPITAFRGSLGGLSRSSEELREIARGDEQAAETRRLRGR